MKLPHLLRQDSRLTSQRIITSGSFLLMFIALNFAFAKMIANQRVMPLISLFGIAGYTALIPLRLKFALLILAALLPLSFGKLGPIPAFLWVEWMGPIVFVIMLCYVFASRKWVIPSKCSVVMSSVVVIVISALINCCQHPVLRVCV